LFLRHSCFFKSLGSLFHCCPPVPLKVSSRTSVLSGFLVQPRPCFVRDNCVPYTVQEWHNGSSHCKWKQTPSGTHHSSGSVTSTFSRALWLDATPHAASSQLQKFPLWPLP
jgi:hypothetical protein